MFPKRNVLAKITWMGIAALVMAMIMVLNPVLAMAEESGHGDDIVIFSSDGDQTVITGDSDTVRGDELEGSTQGKAAAILDDEEIWALVDKDELRSLVDVDSMRNKIDVLALLDSIDRDELRAEIDGEELLAELSEEELEEEFIARKLEGEFFVIGEDGKATMVDEETAKEYKAKKEIDDDNDSDTEPLEEQIEIISADDVEFAEEPLSETEDSLAEIVSEETVVTEDGREIKKFKVKYSEEEANEHPMDIVNVQMPVVSDDSPFDFVIDPMHLLYQTSAARSEENKVEENVGVLFKNTGGDYMFSHKSDMLKVVNKSNVPVKLVITASLENPESVKLVDSASELKGKTPGLFMALTDDVGITSVISSYGEAVIETVLKPVPEGTYKFELDEETGTYKYVLAEDTETTSVDDMEEGDLEIGDLTTDDVETEDTEIGDVADDVVETFESGDDPDIEEPDTEEKKEDSRFDSYSFGVLADCNTDADWSSINTIPVINVTWKVEPVHSDPEEAETEVTDDDRTKFLADKEEYVAFKLVKTAELVEERLLELLQVKLEELKEIELEKLIEEEVVRMAYEILAEALDEKGFGDLFEKTDSQAGDENVEIISSEENSSGSTGAEEGDETDNDVLIIQDENGANSTTAPENKEIDFFETPDN